MGPTTLISKVKLSQNGKSRLAKLGVQTLGEIPQNYSRKRDRGERLHCREGFGGKPIVLKLNEGRVQLSVFTSVENPVPFVIDMEGANCLS
jgi:hypothetical protein